MDELRCPTKLHAILDDYIIEFKCRSRWCGAQRGVVVIHRFDARTGIMVETQRFADPAVQLETPMN